MSCGEPASWSDQFKLPEPAYTYFGTAEEMKWNEYTEEVLSLDVPALSVLSDIEYFQRKINQATGIPEKYLGGAKPTSKDDMCSQRYLDGSVFDGLRDVIVEPKPAVYLDTTEEFNQYFGLEGSMALDTTMNKLFAHDGDDWKLVEDFDLFSVSMVADPLLDECKILSHEDKFDKAMEGV